MYYFIISARFPFYWISHYIHYYTIGQDVDFVQYFNSQNQMSSTQLLNSLLIFCNSQFIIKYTVTYLYKVWNQFTSNKSNTKRSKLLKKYDRKDITLSLCYKIQKKNIWTEQTGFCNLHYWLSGVFRSSAILFIKISHWKMYVGNIPYFSLNCNMRYRNQVNYPELRKHLIF